MRDNDEREDEEAEGGGTMHDRIQAWIAAHPPVFELGVPACPQQSPGCAGPDKPWPCSHCGMAWMAAQEAARALTGDQQATVEASRAEVRALLPGLFS